VKSTPPVDHVTGLPLVGMSDARPAILVLGATGVVGRNLVEFLVNGNLASTVRAVDKRVPPRAFLKWVAQHGRGRLASGFVTVLCGVSAAGRTWPRFRVMQ
jgi:nucleoside-diphosphate-sugar epimerase